MTDEIQPTTEQGTHAPAAAPGTSVEEPRGRRMARMRRLVDEHPVALLAGVAAVGAVTGLEWAAGALIGLGAGALLGGRPTHEVRAELRRRFRNWLGAEQAGSQSGG
jgi:hypothetical protein